MSRIYRLYITICTIEYSSKEQLSPTISYLVSSINKDLPDSEKVTWESTLFGENTISYSFSYIDGENKDIIIRSLDKVYSKLDKHIVDGIVEKYISDVKYHKDITDAISQIGVSGRYKLIEEPADKVESISQKEMGA